MKQLCICASIDLDASKHVHRDVSVDNLMDRKTGSEVCGVLTDFEHEKDHRYENGKERKNPIHTCVLLDWVQGCNFKKIRMQKHYGIL